MNDLRKGIRSFQEIFMNNFVFRIYMMVNTATLEEQEHSFSQSAPAD